MADPDFIKPDHYRGKICTYCDAPLTELGAGPGPRNGSTKSKDHVVPRKLGLGYHRAIDKTDMAAGRGNGVWCCQRCNSLKDSLLPDQVRIMAGYHDERAALLRQIADRSDQIIKHRRLLP